MDDDEPAALGLPPEDKIASRLKQLLLIVGDKTQSSVEDNLQDLSFVLEEDFETHHDYILETLFHCVLALPSKTPIYGTLVGLLNEKNSQFGLDVVQRTQLDLFKALQDNDHDKARMFLRFLGCLVNASVVTADSCLQVMSDILKSVDEEKLEGNTADLVLFDVLFCIPWVGETLSSQVGEAFDQFMNTADSLMESRASASRSVTAIASGSAVVTCGDYLANYWTAVKECQENKWENTASIQKPHKVLQDVLARAAPHKCEMDIVPSQAVTVPYQLRTDLRVYDPQLGLDQGISSIDRLITCDYISDVMLRFQSLPTEGTKQLLALPVPFAYFHLIVETLLSLAFHLPSPLQRPIYYFGIMVNLIRAQPKKMPPLLGRAINSMFQNVQYLDCEIRDRLSTWFSFHLSNFNFEWPWKNWAVVLEQADDSHQKLFIRESLGKCIRLAYWDKISKTLPENLVSVLPPSPTPYFKFSKQDNSQGPGLIQDFDKRVELASALLALFKEKTNTNDLVEWFDGTVSPALGPDARLDIFVPSLLKAGANTYTHIFTLIKRYSGLFSKLGSATPENQKNIVNMVAEFWQRSPQHVMVILDKLSSARVVNAPSIISFCFERTSEFASSPVWEVLSLIVGKTHRSMESYITQLQEQERSATSPDKQEEVRHKLSELGGQKKKLFTMVFKQFCRVISENTSDRLSEELKGRMIQFHREFADALFTVADDVKKEAFSSSQSDEEMLELFNATSAQLQSLRV